MVSGRHFLQIPGPTNVPEQVLQAMARPTIDHRGPGFADLYGRVHTRLQQVFDTVSPVLVYPSSGTGAWEATLVNTLDPGDRVLMYETGHFATLWADMARTLGLEVEWLPGDWRHAVDPVAIEEALSRDSAHRIKAVAVTHTETSTGVTAAVPDIRAAIDRTDHPALLFVDAVSSLASTAYHHDAWGVDVTVSASQKGLMLPPGLSFTAISDRALSVSRAGATRRSYWSWEAILNSNATGYFPYTPATNLLFGLIAAIDLLLEEGLDQVFARHQRLAEATRLAVEAWGLQIFASAPQQRSNAVTAVEVPEGYDADALRQLILHRFDVSLGTGLGRVKGRIFRIGHLGYLNEPMLLGTLASIEGGLVASGVPIERAGLRAALDHLVTTGSSAR